MLSSQKDDAIAFFKKQTPNPRPGGSYDVTEVELKARFDVLSNLFKSESKALNVVQAVPAVLTVSKERVKANFEVYEAKWGYEKTCGVLLRNPNLFNVPTRGYGSAETSGEETIIVSYVVAATRPIGGVLLGLLFISLAKGVINGFMGN